MVVPCPLRHLVILALAATCVFPSVELAAESPFSDMVVVGASFSRSNRRLTNGLVWNEFLASQLGIPAASTTETNYADGGNTSEQMKGQVSRYLSEHTPSDSTLVGIGLVANDFIRDQSIDPAIPANNIVGIIRDLAGAGAKHFVMPIQSLGPSPNAASRAGGSVEFFAAVEAQFDTSFPVLESELGISIYRADWPGVFSEITTNPATHGFTNVAAPGGRDSDTPHQLLWWDAWHPTTSAHRLLGAAAFDAMGISDDIAPVSLSADGYQQDFDEIGRRGQMNTPLPAGWSSVVDGSSYTSITGDNSAKVGFGGETYNLGRAGDRTLGIGTTNNTDSHRLQLSTTTGETGYSSVRIDFDIEAWGISPALAETPGEAAFDVLVEQKQAGGYVAIGDVGTVTTGPTLRKKGVRVDGRDEGNYLSYSAMVAVDATLGSDLRISWTTPTGKPTTGWAFGLDNVRVTLGVYGDFDGDGQLNVQDVDLLAGNFGDTSGLYDLTRDNAVDGGDLAEILRIADRLPGDADFDGEVQFGDFLVLAENFGGAGGVWSKGDFDVDGKVDFPDFLILAENFGRTAGTVASVPEPAAVTLLMLACLACTRRRRIAIQRN